jgi:hypothetical protein
MKTLPVLRSIEGVPGGLMVVPLLQARRFEVLRLLRLKRLCVPQSSLLLTI